MGAIYTGIETGNPIINGVEQYGFYGGVEVFGNDIITGQPGQIRNYSYTGNVQNVTLPVDKYLLECWGARGCYGNRHQIQGGYSYQNIILTTATTIFIVVGGGDRGGSTSGIGGGGASHIATRTGLLSTLNSYRSYILIVAGGAGAEGNGLSSGMTTGMGDGTTGQNGTGNATGGTQTTGYSFGVGMNGGGTSGGGGGGFFGGGAPSSGNFSGAGGSGYISDSINGKTIRQDETGFIMKPNGSAEVNGYIRITTLI